MAKIPHEKIDEDQRVIDELISIKRLIVSFLLQSGMSQKQVAKALGVDQSSVSRMLAVQVRRERKKRNG